jgi:trehalose 6-phosphate synthase
MSRIVVVSNRVASTGQAVNAGGVAVALAHVMETRDALWLGWSGDVVAELPDAPSSEASGRGQLVTVPLTYDEHRDYYLGYANSVLWPTFHNRLDLALFEGGFYQAYAEVNRRFAAALLPLLRPTDAIWVHDYHFLTLASALRELGATNAIGFFLHIPFPPTQAYLALPEFEILADALSAYDLIGLQSTADVARLVGTLEDAVAARLMTNGRVRMGDREVAIGSFPIGIDQAFFEHTEISDDLLTGPGLRLIGADRLDYTKGLPHKFRAFGRFLEKHANYRGHVVLTQIAAPSRESVEAYTDIRSELEALCGSINGRFGTLDWVPIHYINRTAPRAQLAGVYRSSRIGLVTPLADGMNLVAKEYVAAQSPDDPGVLILSRFAGAAEELAEAMIVNPYDIDGVADAIRHALEMPLEERRWRQSALLRRVRRNDATAWAEGFLFALERVRHRDAGMPHNAMLLRSMRRLSSVAPGNNRPKLTAAGG